MVNKTIKCKTKEIVINDFSKFNLGRDSADDAIKGANIYNFKVEKGVLKFASGLTGIKTYASNDKTSEKYDIDYKCLNLEYINKVMHFKQYFSTSGNTTHRLLIHGSDSKLYLFQMFSNLDTPNWVYSLTFNTVPIVLQYKKDGLDSILISSDDKLMVWTTGRTPYEVANVPPVTSMCVLNDTLFCTVAGEVDKIWYSSNLDPENLNVESDETGYLIMSGETGGGTRVVKLGENIFVFCNYGIGRINTYVKKQPTYNQIYVTNSQIYANTVTECGGCVMFATSEGLYKFNGSSVQRVDMLQNLMMQSDNRYAVATHFQDSYYLATHIDFGDNLLLGSEMDEACKNNVLIKLNLSDYSFEIMRGLDIKDILALKAGVEEKIVLTFNSDKKDLIGEVDENVKGFFGESINAYYSTNYFIENDISKITINQIEFEASKGAIFKIITDSECRQFTALKEGINCFRTTLPCKKFRLEISNTNVDGGQDMFVNWVKVSYIKQL